MTTRDGKKEVRTGFYVLREYPDGRNAFKQTHLLTSAFNIIKSEFIKMQNRR